MIDKTISTLALLKSLYQEDMHIIDCYIPLVKHIIVKHNITQISEQNCEIIEDAFLSEFGLSVPYFGIVSIINRIDKKIVRKVKTVYSIDVRMLSQEKTIDPSRFETGNREFIDGFKLFSTERFKTVPTEDEINCAFLQYLTLYSNEIVYTLHAGGTLPSIKQTSKAKQNLFILGEYFKSRITEPGFIEYMTDLALGVIISESLLLNGYEPYSCNYQGLIVYLDVHFLFFFVGVGGEYLQRTYISYILALKKAGIVVKVLDQNLDEFYRNMDDCATWIDNPSFNEEKASRTLLYFYEKHLHESDVQLFKARVSDIFSDPYNVIEVKCADVPQIHNLYIDEKELQDLICDNYKKTNSHIDSRTRDVIYRDVNAISIVYRLRKRAYIRNIKQAQHIFITGNATLAFSAYQYHSKFEKELGSIPACISCQFMSNLLWLEKPGSSEKQTIKLHVVSNIMQLTELSQTVFKKFLHELKILHEQGKISVETLADFKHNIVVHQLLKDKTLNDSTMFTGQTTQEIIQNYKDEIVAPYQAQIEQEKRDRDKLAVELDREKTDKNTANGEKKETQGILDGREEALVINSVMKAKRLSNIIYWVLVVSIFSLAIYAMKENLVIWTWVSGLLTLTGLVNNWTLKLGKSHLQRFLTRRNIRIRCIEQNIKYSDFIAKHSDLVKDTTR